MMSDGKIVCIFGSTRSGKTTHLLEQIKTASRLIVWDVKGEFQRFIPGVKTLTDIKELHKWIVQHKTIGGKVAFQSIGLTHFDEFAKLSFAWAQFAPVSIVVDESSDVTRPGKAAGWWGVVLRRVLDTGSNVYVVSQRPTESESTSSGNASIIHCGRLSRPTDRKTVSDFMDVSPAQIAALKQYEYLEKDLDTHDLVKGKTRKPRQTSRKKAR